MNSQDPDHTPDHDDESETEVPKHVRRFAILLILVVVAALAVAVWGFSSWFGNRFFSDRNVDIPPLPPIGGEQSSGGES